MIDSPPDVGYCVTVDPGLASYRLRVAVPSQHLGLSYQIGSFGRVCFFFKHIESDVELAASAQERGTRIIYDVVNDHFDGQYGQHYRSMILLADVVTCGSDWMRRRILERLGKSARVIDDPYENAESEPECLGRDVLWFGHGANLQSALPAFEDVARASANLRVCTNSNHRDVVLWTLQAERRELNDCALVLLTSNNEGASTNRVVKAIRAGRFVVAQDVESWGELRDFIWIGDVREGIEWALSHRKEACEMVRAGQEYVRERKSPQAIGQEWSTVMREQLRSISDQETTTLTDG